MRYGLHCVPARTRTEIDLPPRAVLFAGNRTEDAAQVNACTLT